MKTAIVTGANAGVGFEVTRGLRDAGYRVVMACRNAGKALAAKAALEQTESSGALVFEAVDLAEKASIDDFAGRMREKVDRLDLIVNNAAILDYSRGKSEDGHDLQFAVNHLGHFRLNALLLPMMADDSASRIVTLASLAHRRGGLDFVRLKAGELNPSRQAYGDSKLANLVYALELDRRLRQAGREMQSIAAHPGVSVTELFEDVPWYYRTALWLAAPVLTHSPASAARSVLHACLEPGLSGGDYVGPQGPFEMRGAPGPAKRTKASGEPALGQALWQASEEMTGLRFTI